MWEFGALLVLGVVAVGGGRFDMPRSAMGLGGLICLGWVGRGLLVESRLIGRQMVGVVGCLGVAGCVCVSVLVAASTDV